MFHGDTGCIEEYQDDHSPVECLTLHKTTYCKPGKGKGQDFHHTITGVTVITFMCECVCVWGGGGGGKRTTQRSGKKKK